MKYFKKSAKFIISYLLLKWLLIGVIGWQIAQTDWFKIYYANDFIWWHLLIVPATLLPIILLVKFIKINAAKTNNAAKNSH